MKIHINFDEELLIKRIKQDSPILFEIAWENDGTYYPDKNWIDFGIVIIGWWFYVASEIPNELTESKLSFMDGPYSIKVSFDKKNKAINFEPDGLDVVWRTSVKDFRQELIRAANIIIEKLLEMKIQTQSLSNLEKSVEFLKSLE